ncbi:hypothetical protein GGR42_000546 [Saonia flava]|uniref:DUF308 domain-containing protein n=1 Tax=Saonia flava TaxID=523696 RepID=A0A846QY94_9FLAO|nr:hypothetical protein [Saonia flava]NJB70084.1 hypothetical protein [Saonia flava]
MSNQKKYLTIPIRISLLLILVGMLFKALHWIPVFTNGIILCSFVAISILYSLRFSKKQTKGSIAYIKLVLVIFWSLNGIFTILHLPYGEVFQIVSLIAFLFWTAMEGTSYFFNKEAQENNTSYLLWNGIMILGAFSIVLGTLFSFLNWDYAVPLLVFGISSVVVYILRDVFAQKQEGETSS